MTPPKKPDWMEIADGDYQAPAAVSKKRRPLLFAMTALLVTVGGVVVAQTHDESPASADEIIAPQSSQSATTVAPAINPTPQSAPAIATPPSAKGGDGDDDRGFRDHRPDGDRQFGEHDGREGGDHGDDDFEEH
ncbi:MAG: hypothetical protein RL201_366 [Actinomycetota bacterium]